MKFTTERKKKFFPVPGAANGKKVLQDLDLGDTFDMSGKPNRGLDDTGKGPQRRLFCVGGGVCVKKGLEQRKLRNS